MGKPGGLGRLGVACSERGRVGRLRHATNGSAGAHAVASNGTGTRRHRRFGMVLPAGWLLMGSNCGSRLFKHCWLGSQIYLLECRGGRVLQPQGWPAVTIRCRTVTWNQGIGIGARMRRVGSSLSQHLQVLAGRKTRSVSSTRFLLAGFVQRPGILSARCLSGPITHWSSRLGW